VLGFLEEEVVSQGLIIRGSKIGLRHYFVNLLLLNFSSLIREKANFDFVRSDLGKPFRKLWRRPILKWLS
jgi:hypothetical protein